MGADYGKPASLHDAAEYALEAWSDLSEQKLNKWFLKAEITPTLKKYDSWEEPENFEELLAVFPNCSYSSRIDIKTFAQKIRDVFHMDDASDAVYKQSILEDINDIIKHVEKARTVSEQNEDEGNDANNLAVTDCPTIRADFSDIINKAI